VPSFFAWYLADCWLNYLYIFVAERFILVILTLVAEFQFPIAKGRIVEAENPIYFFSAWPEWIGTGMFDQ